MEKNEKNVTNEEFMPFLEAERMDVSEAESKDGSKYYKFSFLYTHKGNTSLIKTYTKDRSLYNDLLAIPRGHKFKLYYDVGVNREYALYIIPIACSL